MVPQPLTPSAAYAYRNHFGRRGKVHCLLNDPLLLLGAVRHGGC